MKLLAAVCVLGLAAATSAAATGKKPDHRALYQQAEQARKKLEASATLQKTTAEWKRVVEKYRSVVHYHPQSPYCDNSLLAVGDLYAAMARRFKAPRYREHAIEAYRLLVAEYPSSSLGEEALFKAFQLASASGEDRQVAEATQAYLEAYPAGKNARAVKSVVKNKAAPSPPPPEFAKVFGDKLRFWSGKTSTRVVIELERQVKIEHQERLADPDRLFIDLSGTRLHPKQAKQTFPVDDGLLKEVYVAQNRPGVVRVVLASKEARDHKTFFLADPPRLVIDVNNMPPSTPAPMVAESFPTPAPGEFDPPTPAPTATPARPFATELRPSPRAAPTPTPAPSTEIRRAEVDPPPTPAPSRNTTATMARVLGLGVRTIVIDAGHGGHDPGCHGRGGTEEKDVVLDVALRLAKLVKSELGADVVLTRSTDVFVPLEERTAIANKEGADLFLSIHANSARDRNASGLETYYLNFTQDPHAEEVAARENAMSMATMKDLGGLVQAIALNSKIVESRDFASYVQQAMVAGLKPHNRHASDRGVKKAPFVVLIGANMPSILTEITFLTNPNEERLAATSEYRDRIARSLLVGVRRYLEVLNRAPAPQLTANRRGSTVSSNTRVLPPIEPSRKSSRR